MDLKKPTLLLVLDGWGHAAASASNAITHAPAANFLDWWEKWPHALLSASGKEVGLPLGLMGNSEVGHTNIGAGRVVYQTISRIDADLASGLFQRNSALRGAIEHARVSGTQLHLFGLLGDGGVHASNGHYRALLELAQQMGMPGERIVFHALLDGRDTPPRSAGRYLAELEQMLAQFGGRIGTVCGRYFAMDRDSRWDRTELFWKALVHGQGHRAESAEAAYQAALERGESDEFMQATVVSTLASASSAASASTSASVSSAASAFTSAGASGAASASTSAGASGAASRMAGSAGCPGRLVDGDAVICFNFRSDRVRQISEVLLNEKFSHFDRGLVPKVHYVTMTQYRKDFPCPIAYPPVELHSLFGELVAAQGLRQFRCAETEKYAHVTFFFNGGREEVYPGEDRVLIPSPHVATYDLQPQMSAPLVTDAVVDHLGRGEHDLYVVNFANADMVGHTGLESAAEEAVRAVDASLKRIVDAALARGGNIVITADHGNAEMMIDPVSGEVHTAHTINPVPFLLIGEDFRGSDLRPMGILADVAPTLMEAMSIDQPDVMDGRSLLQG